MTVSKPFYKKPGFWIKIILVGAACAAPFIPDHVKKIISIFILGA
jgi:hypothetical protein